MSQDKTTEGGDNHSAGNEEQYKIQYQREKRLREQAEFVLESKEQELSAVNRILESQTKALKKLELKWPRWLIN